MYRASHEWASSIILHDVSVLMLYDIWSRSGDMEIMDVNVLPTQPVSAIGSVDGHMWCNSP